MEKNLISGEFFNELIKRAGDIERTMAFSDGNDHRLIKALDYFMDKNKSNYILIGDENKMLDNIKDAGIKNTDNFMLVDPRNSKRFEEFREIIKESFIKRNKTLTDEQLKINTLNNSYWASVLLKNNEADCAVGGSISSTADLMRAVINVLGLLPGRKFLSGAAFVDVPDCIYGLNGKFCVTDPAIIPKPNQDQLLNMVLSSYETAKSVFREEPIVAMLSYSTWGSADGEEIEKIRNVVEIIKNTRPDILIDGELQLDAAIVPEVAKIKVPTSIVGGRANVLVFPDLNAANIGYKIMQRLAKADVCGTVVQGAAKPFNDLSRGCLVQDMVTLIAMTLLQTKGLEDSRQSN
ncbi:MAG: phosphate acetyltransferase [Actinobacteria bacterium]|nr:phosphate acetyltransferase [Actinomycetota bacterium]